MKLTTFSTPKISVSPAATGNSSMPMIRSPVACVARQAEAGREPGQIHDGRSKRWTIVPNGNRRERAPVAVLGQVATEHNPEKLKPVFRKDHASPKS